MALDLPSRSKSAHGERRPWQGLCVYRSSDAGLPETVRRSMFRKLLLIAAAATLVGACERSATRPDPEVSTIEISDGLFDLPILTADDEADETVVRAQLSFTYSGHRSGSFSLDNTFAVGDMSLDDSFGYVSYNPDWNDQDFYAWQRQEDGRIDYIELWVDGAITAPGAATVYFGFLILGWDPVTDSEEAVYVLDGAPGAMHVSTATEARLAGTFELQGQSEETAAALAADATADPAVRVRPLRPRPPLR
jgi:hypothetical protein